MVEIIASEMGNWREEHEGLNGRWQRKCWALECEVASVAKGAQSGCDYEGAKFCRLVIGLALSAWLAGVVEERVEVRSGGYLAYVGREIKTSRLAVVTIGVYLVQWSRACYSSPGAPMASQRVNR